MTYALALHTSSPDLGLAIDNFAGDARSQVWDLGRALSTHLHAYLQEFLQPQTFAELAFLAIATGPGSFTGTRIGVVTARTLAQQFNLPLFGISSLAAYAYGERSRRLLTPFTNSSTAPSDVLSDAPTDIGDIAVQMPAQRGELYTAIYSQVDGRWSALAPDAVLTGERWQELLAGWPRPYHLLDVGANLGCCAVSVLHLAYLDWKKGDRPDWSTALPFYGQLCVGPVGGSAQP
ncbi:MAG TPA: tRNA (adenosine(37)-N6)-threonylcarbamoyltransferase complex dimerization subunit type 1 TsaB [Chroococcidiopsis sp.]